MDYANEIKKEFEGLNLSAEEKVVLANAFAEVDQDKTKSVEVDELGKLLKLASCPMPSYKVRIIINDMQKTDSDKFSPAEFAKIYIKETEDRLSKTFKEAVKSQQGIVTEMGSSDSSAAGTQHSYSKEETMAFTNWVTKRLSTDPDCQKYVKGLKADSIFQAMDNGIVLCKMINLAQPETIDERTINKKKLNVYTIQENNNLALNSASAIGCNIVNIGAQDISEGTPHLILGLIWQVIRVYLFNKINLLKTGDIAALLEEGETLQELMSLPPDQLLLRWMNYHLANSTTYQENEFTKGKKITNFNKDIKDSIAYTCLLEQIQPVDEETRQYELMPPITAHITTSGSTERAQKMLAEADRLGCNEFVTPKEIVTGNTKLNMAFVANLFNTHPALQKVDMEEIVETREVKTYRNWMNSLGVVPRVYHFSNDLKDGIVLLQLYGHLDKDAVDDKKVNKPPYTAMGGNMKKLENCNYVINLGKKMNFSLVGIDGRNINEGDETLTLALVWQLMRDYTFKILQDISADGTTTKDKEIVAWANDKLAKGGKETSITSFKDKSIATSHVVLDLIDCVKPGSIDYDIVSSGDSEEEKMSNAKYAISMARKIGSKIYALPEDLVEVNQKMVMTVFACLMATAMDNVEDSGAAAE